MMNTFIELHEASETAKRLSAPLDVKKEPEVLIKHKILINTSQISLIEPHDFLTLKGNVNFDQSTMGDTITKITLLTQKTIFVAESYNYISKILKSYNSISETLTC